MTTITLKETGTNLYQPDDETSLALMQHCVNEDLVAINSVGLEKLKTVADAHNWLVEIIYL